MAALWKEILLTFTITFLLFTTIDSSQNAQESQNRDDTELDDETEAGGDAPPPVVVEQIPPVKQEAADDTELDDDGTEVREEESHTHQPSTSTDDPVDLLKIRKQQLEETLIHVRSNFLKRRSIIASPGDDILKSDDDEAVDAEQSKATDSKRNTEMENSDTTKKDGDTGRQSNVDDAEEDGLDMEMDSNEDETVDYSASKTDVADDSSDGQYFELYEDDDDEFVDDDEELQDVDSKSSQNDGLASKEQTQTAESQKANHFADVGFDFPGSEGGGKDAENVASSQEIPVDVKLKETEGIEQVEKTEVVKNEEIPGDVTLKSNDVTESQEESPENIVKNDADLKNVAVDDDDPTEAPDEPVISGSEVKELDEDLLKKTVESDPTEATVVDESDKPEVHQKPLEEKVETENLLEDQLKENIVSESHLTDGESGKLDETGLKTEDDEKRREKEEGESEKVSGVDVGNNEHSETTKAPEVPLDTRSVGEKVEEIGDRVYSTDEMQDAVHNDTEPIEGNEQDGVKGIVTSEEIGQDGAGSEEGTLDAVHNETELNTAENDVKDVLKETLEAAKEDAFDQQQELEDGSPTSENVTHDEVNDLMEDKPRGNDVSIENQQKPEEDERIREKDGEHSIPGTDEGLGDIFDHQHGILGKEGSSDSILEDESLQKHTPTVFTLRPYFIIAENALSRMDPMLEDIVNKLPPEVQKLFLKAPFALTPSRALLLFAMSCVSLAVISSCVCIQSRRQKSRQSQKQSMVEQLATVQRSLVISEQEKLAATTELESVKKQVESYENRSNLTSDEVDGLSKQVESLSAEKADLQQKLSEQLTKITDLSSTVSSQARSVSTESEKNVTLQSKLDDTTSHATLLETQLYELQTTLQQSQTSALEMQSQLQSMTEEISILQTSKDQLLLEAEGWNEKVQEQAEQIARLLEQEKTAQEAINLKDEENSQLREFYQQLKFFESSDETSEEVNGGMEGEDEDEEEKKKRLKNKVQEKIKDLTDVAQLNAKLKAFEEEKNSLKHALSVEMESRIELEDQMKLLKAEKEELMESRSEAEQQRSTTMVKMDVLMNYFKEKETELNRKLGEQEARERASADQLVNSDEKTKEFEKMVRLYKEQVEDLQKEIQSIEADYRKQIALQEKKAHQNWLVARQSEREVKEYKTESQMLRHKILELQNKLDAANVDTKSAGQDTTQMATAVTGIPNGMPPLLPGEDRPTSRPILQPAFVPPPPFGHVPFLPLDRPLPPPLFGPPLRPPPPPPMMFDRRQLDMRSSPAPYDMWSHPPRRSPAMYRDRSPPRNRSPSPGRRGPSPTSFRSGHHSPPRNVQSPPAVIGDRQSPSFHGPRGGPPPGNAKPSRPPYSRGGADHRSGPRPQFHPTRSDPQTHGMHSSNPNS